MATKKTAEATNEKPRTEDVEELEDDDDSDVEAMGRGVSRRKGVKTKAEKRREFANWCVNNKYASQAEITKAFNDIVGA